MDPSLQYSFIFNYDHRPVAYQSVSGWLNDQSYIAYLCDVVPAKRSLLVPKEIIRKNQDINVATITSLVVFPNPTQGKININSGGKINVYIYNTLGEEIMHQSCNGNCSINLPILDNGIYIMKIFNVQNNLIDTKKVSLIK